MSKVDWSLAPVDAQYGGIYEGKFSCWYMRDGDQWLYTSNISGAWEKVFDNRPSSELVRRPKPKQWSGPQDGLPPVGLEIEARIDFKKAPPYTVIGLTELGVDVQRHVPRFQKVTVLYVSDKYLVSFASGVECLTPMSCVEIRAIKTKEQAANEQRETAIRELMDIAQVDCRVTAARLVDAGFKRDHMKF